MALIVPSIASGAVPHPRWDDSTAHLLPRVQRAVDRIAGQHVTVECGETPASDVAGYALGPDAASFIVQPGWCALANRMTRPAARRETSSPGWRYLRDAEAQALLTLAHEAEHDRVGRVDWQNEGAVECSALADIYGFARGLGAGPELALDLARRARRIHAAIVAGHPAYACPKASTLSDTVR